MKKKITRKKDAGVARKIQEEEYQKYVKRCGRNKNIIFTKKVVSILKIKVAI